MTDPTPAEIDAGTERLQLAARMAGTPPVGRILAETLARAVLRAVLPDHDTRLRADVAEEIAREITADCNDTSAHRPDDYRDGMRHAARIARAHTTGGDHG